MLDPIAYEDKYKDTRQAESASQRALFMYANMATNFGLRAANYTESYSVKGAAAKYLEDFNDRIPQLKYLFAIHNQGHGDAVHGARAVAEGLKKGVPDISLCVTIGGSSHNTFLQSSPILGFNGRFLYAGLYIELKRKQVLTEGKRKALIQARSQGRASTEQEDWQAFLRQQGYVCEICYGFEEARDLILRYLKEGGLI